MRASLFSTILICGASACTAGGRAGVGLDLSFASDVSAGALGQVVALDFLPRGDETTPFQIALGRQANREERITYRPDPNTRHIAIEVDAVDTSGARIATGSTEMLTLTQGGFVDAAVVLSTTDIEMQDMSVPDMRVPDMKMPDLKNSDMALPSGLIGHWSLDDGQGVVALDSSMSGNNAAVLNTYEWLSAAEDGGGLHLDDDSELSVTALSGSIFPQIGTLSFWFRGPLATPDTLYSLFDGYDSTRDHLFVRGNLGSTVQVVCQTLGDSTPYTASETPPMVVDQWNHVVLVWQTSASGMLANPSLTVFMNGVESTSSIVPVTWSPTQQQFTFGGYGAIDLDEIELYDVALSAAEIETLP